MGTPVGCDTSNCGACTVRPGRAEREVAAACSPCRPTAARSRPSRAWPTASGTRCRPPSRSATACSAATARPGMIMASIDLLKENPNPSEEEIRDGLEGNLCRCTGYQNIVKSVQHAAAARRCAMTDTLERPARAERRRPADAPQGGRAAGHRPHQLDRQHRAARAAATWRSCAARWRTPGSPASTSRRRWPGPASSPPSRRKELGDKLGSMPCVWPVTDDIKIPPHPPLATDEVRFVGDAVAVVVAGRPLPRRRRARGDRGRLRAAAAGPGHEGRDRRRSRPGAHRARHQQVVHVEARRRRLRGRQGQGRPGVHPPLRQPAADPDGDGAARRRRRARRVPTAS